MDSSGRTVGIIAIVRSVRARAKHSHSYSILTLVLSHYCLAPLSEWWRENAVPDVPVPAIRKDLPVHREVIGDQEEEGELGRESVQEILLHPHLLPHKGITIVRIGNHH